MFVFLSKLLAFPLNPIGLSLTLFAAGFACAYAFRGGSDRVRKYAVYFYIAGASVLLIFSLPITSHILARGLESRYPPVEIYEQASAVVFLGGATSGKAPPRAHVEVNQNANRVFNAVRMYRQTYSAKLVLTGGMIGYMSTDTIPEAHAMFELLHEFFGIDSSDVILECESRNTRENAVHTKMALEEAGLGSDIILVTSAYHMPRSVGIFKKAGFSRVIPAPAGYLVDERFCLKPLTWLPSTGSLTTSSIALHEYYGLIVYKVMGWI